MYVKICAMHFLWRPVNYILAAPGFTYLDYCCSFSPLQFTGNAVSLYRIESLRSSTSDACLMWQPMGTMCAFQFFFFH